MSHELVLVTVYAHKGTNVRKDILKGIHKLEGVSHMGTNMRKDILKGIHKLEGIGVAKPVLDMDINDKLHEAQDFLTQVESIPRMRLLPLFHGQRPMKPIVNKRRCRRIGITYFTGFKFIL
jgi:hypothetical protein